MNDAVDMAGRPPQQSPETWPQRTGYPPAHLMRHGVTERLKLVLVDAVSSRQSPAHSAGITTLSCAESAGTTSSRRFVPPGTLGA